MDIIGRIRQAAEQAVAELQQRAQEEGWDVDRIEREKSLFQLRHELTLCARPGCLQLVEPLPGFRDLCCPACSSASP